MLAFTIAAEIRDISRFPSAKKPVGHTGLCRMVHQSGEKNRRGPLSKPGPTYLRWAMLEATMHTLRHPAYRSATSATNSARASNPARESSRSTSPASSPRRSGTYSPTTSLMTLPRPCRTTRRPEQSSAPAMPRCHSRPERAAGSARAAWLLLGRSSHQRGAHSTTADNRFRTNPATPGPSRRAAGSAQLAESRTDATGCRSSAMPTQSCSASTALRLRSVASVRARSGCRQRDRPTLASPTVEAIATFAGAARLRSWKALVRSRRS